MYLRGGMREVKVAQFKVAKVCYLMASAAECCWRGSWNQELDSFRLHSWEC